MFPPALRFVPELWRLEIENHCFFKAPYLGFEEHRAAHPKVHVRKHSGRERAFPIWVDPRSPLEIRTGVEHKRTAMPWSISSGRRPKKPQERLPNLWQPGKQNFLGQVNKRLPKQVGELVCGGDLRGEGIPAILLVVADTQWNHDRRQSLEMTV